jgi:hypothetical protein
LFVGHDPEKWLPVFRKDHAQTKRWGMIVMQAGATAGQV